MTSVGTVTAFFLVSVATGVLRYTEPDLPRKFKIPGGAIGGYGIPFLSAFFSALLFSQTTTAAIARVFIWMAVGLVIYFVYGYHNSLVGREYEAMLRNAHSIPVMAQVSSNRLEQGNSGSTSQHDKKASMTAVDEPRMSQRTLDGNSELDIE
eukprot:jgi/Hompol1/340/HPOL_001133-RA